STLVYATALCSTLNVYIYIFWGCSYCFWIVVVLLCYMLLLCYTLSLVTPTGEALKMSLYKYNDNKGFSIYLFLSISCKQLLISSVWQEGRRACSRVPQHSASHRSTERNNPSTVESQHG